MTKKLSEELKKQEQQALSGDWPELAQMFSDFASEAEALETELKEYWDGSLEERLRNEFTKSHKDLTLENERLKEREGEIKRTLSRTEYTKNQKLAEIKDYLDD